MGKEIPRFIGIAAGAIKTIAHVKDGLGRLVDHITFGSFTLEERFGNKEPVYWYDEVRRISVNAVGLKNPGLRAFIAELRAEEKRYLALKRQGCRIRLSLAPLKEGDLTEMAEILWENRDIVFLLIDEVEINASCPNHRSTGGQLHPVLAHDVVALETLMVEGREILLPKAIKIAPIMNGLTLLKTVDFALKYGYSWVVSHNTLPVSSLICGEQRLYVDRGGLGGALLLNDAVSQVETLVGIIKDARTPLPLPKVIGCGGVMDVDGAQRHLTAGAVLLQIGTYFHQFGVRGVQDLVVGLAMTEEYDGIHPGIAIAR